MQRPWNWRGGECQHIGVESESFEAFLVFDTEAMLLVDDDESELREVDVRTQQPVRTDDDVHLPCFQILQHCLLLFRRLKTAHRLNVHRKISQPLTEGSRVLIGE